MKMKTRLNLSAPSNETKSAETNLLTVASISEKLFLAHKDLEPAQSVPERPGRDLQVLGADQMPPRRGLSTTEGQGRLLHDLANIELQAVELCYRTWQEFPEAPEEFREELVALVRGEANHLALCLGGLHDLGYSWGHWPVHLALWSSVSGADSLLDRILIVHRYLEGNGLDAAETLLRRLTGVPPSPVHAIVGQIAREERDHVRFGTRWFKVLCEAEGRDPSCEFIERFRQVEHRVPHRIEKMNATVRLDLGFSQAEIEFLDQRQRAWSRQVGHE
ncbi:MAG: DUF455 domain-containing protein [Bdellovibrio sp.]|nr:MAG: DUF455 domain-containing protein [Bdellovibrio sp.]